MVKLIFVLLYVTGLSLFHAIGSRLLAKREQDASCARMDRDIHDTSHPCNIDNTASLSNHNEQIVTEFSRQSQSYYQAYTTKTDKLAKVMPLINAANIRPTDTILDLACGPGIITTECALKGPHRVYAMDMTHDMLQLAKTHALEHNVLDKIEFIEGNVEQLPFDNNTFDIVITRWTFHHFDELTKVMSEIYRVLKPHTGKLVFMEFCAPNATQGSDNTIDIFNAMHTIRDPSHVWAYDEVGWLNEVNKGGFAMDSINIVDRFGYPINWESFIEWTNPSESERRARESMNVVGKYFEKCECDVGMNFYNNGNGELMLINNYIVVVANKT